jgi:tripartite-type tricarboxylate transporter receptor subunit TctC
MSFHRAAPLHRHLLLTADWPTKSITLVVPFVAGGTTDIVARTIGQKLSESLKQPVIIDNRGGAGATLGATIASKAPADGYTLFLATIAHSIAPGLYKGARLRLPARLRSGGARGLHAQRAVR